MRVQKFISRKSTILFLIVAVFGLASCISIDSPAELNHKTETDATSPVVTETSMPTMINQSAATTFFPYGVVYPYQSGDWSENDRPEMREQLEYLKSLGINTVIQVFDSRSIGKSEAWLIFLDEAERVDIRVIAQLYPIAEQNSFKFDFQIIREFLVIVKDHPALLAYLGLHEPLEHFNSEQLRAFNTRIKSFAPQLPIAHYMSSIFWFDQNLRYPRREFTAGICDICIIWYYPASYENNNPIFEDHQLRDFLQNNRKLMRNRAPEAELWVLGQAFAQSNLKKPLRMPTPQEMEELFTIAQQEQVDGFLWYPWLHGAYDQILSDDAIEPQRNAIYQIFQKYIITPLPR